MDFFRLSLCHALPVAHAALIGIIFSHGSVVAQETSQGVFVREEFGLATITLAGSIRSGDAEIFEDVLRQQIGKGTSIRVMLLHNDGGSVIDALRIGRMARALDLWVTAGGRCYSSCAIVFAGGSERSEIFSEIGLHRPFFATSNNTVAPSQDEIEDMFASIEEYLKEMNVSQTVFDAMLNVSPENMLILGGEEDIFRLFGKHDPVFSEISNIDTAKQYGISMTEFLEVEATDFIRICEQFSSDFNQIALCGMKMREAMLWKIPQSKAESISVYLGEAYKKCELSEGDRDRLASDQKRLRLLSLERLSPEYQRQLLAHPIREAFRDCVRSYMAQYR